jgi:exodeoxyribonuclease III
LRLERRGRDAMAMRIATWNVNSLKARLPKVLGWLENAQADVLCMQETKLADAQFPLMPFAALGYEVAAHGNGRWNGVAIASRVGLAEVTAGFTSGPRDDEEARIVTARCGGIRFSSIYVPKGRSLDSEQFLYKLDWLERLRLDLVAASSPSEPIAVCGDFNIAPNDADVYDISQFNGATHVSDGERAALQALEEWGLVDAFRSVYPDTPGLFTWWDYRAGDFHKHRGMRIDLVLVSRALAGSVRYALIDREARKGMGGAEPPSDHAPMFVDLD